MNNPKRFSTMMKMLVYTQNGVGETMVAFLRKFNWIDIALICDDNPSLGDFILLACAGFTFSIKHTPGMTLTDLHFNTRRPVDYASYLYQAAMKSRSTLHR